MDAVRHGTIHIYIQLLSSCPSLIRWNSSIVGSFLFTRPCSMEFGSRGVVSEVLKRRVHSERDLDCR